MPFHKKLTYRQDGFRVVARKIDVEDEGMLMAEAY